MRLGWAMCDTLPNPHGGPGEITKRREKDMENEGIVYILVNQSMPGLIKIGMTEGPTSEDLEKRIKSLDRTSVPLPFECFYAAKVPKAREVESYMHDTFRPYRVRAQREFFKVDAVRAQAALKISGGNDMTPGREVIEEGDSDSLNALENATRRSNFNFDHLNLPIGTTLCFQRDESITCTIAGPRRVVFREEEMTLSKAAGIVLEEKNKSRIANGALHWTYKDETIDELRRRLEEENNEDD